MKFNDVLEVEESLSNFYWEDIANDFLVKKNYLKLLELFRTACDERYIKYEIEFEKLMNIFLNDIKENELYSYELLNELGFDFKELSNFELLINKLRNRVANCKNLKDIEIILKITKNLSELMREYISYYFNNEGLLKNIRVIYNETRTFRPDIVIKEKIDDGIQPDDFVLIIFG